MKNSYAIILDASCDFSSALRTRFEIEGCLKGHLTTPESTDSPATNELTDAELEVFYASLKKNKDKYKTSPSSVEEIVSYYETFLLNGQDVLAISMSSTLSVSYNLMLAAKKIALEKYPERKICAVDSMKYSIPIGLLAVKAAQLRAEGRSLEQNAEMLDKIKKTIHQMGSVDDLFWVASKGRISHAKAFFGTVAGVKSMGDFDADGMVTPIAKVSGYKKAYKATVEYVKKTIVSPSEQIVFVAHSARKEQADILASLIRERIKPKEVIVASIQPMSGINIGPGLFAAYYLGAEITDLSREKEILNDIIANKL
ncbi:MAG: DegV family EDD domain-containing protein [Clostridiales bacterium]|jgi:DegV family protein with EDD domain|nr:DegV family EDD domain-containing protein [Clostridiales bacterium]